MCGDFIDRNIKRELAMKKSNLIIASALLAFTPILQSCNIDSDDSYYIMQPTALVTVCPQSDESVFFQLDDVTRLNPVNLKKSPFGNKEVRALVNYSPVSDKSDSPIQDVNVNWIDSIRTKMPVMVTGDYDKEFADDPVEIVKDWVTVAEDGYLTLRLRTVWGPGHNKHAVDLLYTGNTDGALSFELRHNANGDLEGNTADALVAFNLNQLIADMPKPVKIILEWHSFSGNKSAEFSMNSRKTSITNIDNVPECAGRLE